jgi:hypothetical protein
VLRGVDLNRTITIQDSEPDIHIEEDYFAVFSAIYVTVARGNIDCVRTILSSGADADGYCCAQTENCERSLVTPCMLAVRKGDLSSLALLLQAGADPSHIASTKVGHRVSPVVVDIGRAPPERLELDRNLVQLGHDMDSAGHGSQSP